MKIEIITRHIDDLETKLIKDFLDWQGFKAEVIEDSNRNLILTRGHGNAVVVIASQISAEVKLQGFLELVYWFDRNGYFRC